MFNLDSSRVSIKTAIASSLLRSVGGWRGASPNDEMRFHYFMNFLQVRLHIRRKNRPHHLRSEDSLLLKMLTNRGERRVIECRARYVVESNH
jgi:hypothetical protein